IAQQITRVKPHRFVCTSQPACQSKPDEGGDKKTTGDYRSAGEPHYRSESSASVFFELKIERKDHVGNQHDSRQVKLNNPEERQTHHEVCPMARDEAVAKKRVGFNCRHKEQNCA